MRIAYLMNTYPVVSATFIKREIRAIESMGVTVHRFAVREWEQELIDKSDIEEKEWTEYLLSRNLFGLLYSFALEVFTNPLRLCSAILVTFSLVRSARGDVLKHIAYLLQATRFRQRTKKLKVDHVHCHFGTNATTVAMLSKHLGGPGYSFTAHGPDEFTNHHLFNFAAKIESARFVVAISEYCRSILMSLSSMENWDKIEIVHCGLDLTDFTRSPIPPESHFVCVGRFGVQKAQLLIIRAAALVAKEHPDLRVTLVGDGESRPRIEQEIAALNLEETVILTGWQTNEEVRKTISSGRFFLLPSFAEGLPVVLMESYAMGRPAISTYIAGIPELVTANSGWLVPAGSVNAIAEAMKSAIAAPDNQLAEMAKAGLQMVEKNHDVEREAAKLLSHIRSYSVD